MTALRWLPMKACDISDKSGWGRVGSLSDPHLQPSKAKSTWTVRIASISLIILKRTVEVPNTGAKFTLSLHHVGLQD